MTDNEITAIKVLNGIINNIYDELKDWDVDSEGYLVLERLSKVLVNVKQNLLIQEKNQWKVMKL